MDQPMHLLLRDGVADPNACGRRAREAHRNDSLGVLAGGIAHKFNNLLTTICGNASILLEDLPPGAAQALPLADILESVRVAADLCDQMLAYSGRGRFHSTRLDLTRLIQDLAPQLLSMVGEHAELRYDLTVPLPDVEADVQRIHQVVANLVLNASEALDGRRGHVTISTGVMSADHADRTDRVPADALAVEYVFLQVSDNGQGMSLETQARIFEPFFTTRFAGRGLGLAAVQGIVHQHRGTLLVESQPGLGSTFRLLLPSLVSARSLDPPPYTRPGKLASRDLS